MCFFIDNFTNNYKFLSKIMNGNQIRQLVFLLLFVLMSGGILTAQDFGRYEITDSLFNRMCGKSFKPNGVISRNDLCYLRVAHYNVAGEALQGELICHKDIADDLLDIFRALFKARYPIERMVLVDEYDADDEASMQDNNTSAFNFRRVQGTHTLSRHSLGMAIDINPRYNPYVRKRNGYVLVSPDNGKPYADRTKVFPYKIEKGDLCYRLFKKHGFSWGGDWKRSKDYQHFEKR